jgi:hypothetical protein
MSDEELMKRLNIIGIDIKNFMSSPENVRPDDFNFACLSVIMTRLAIIELHLEKKTGEIGELH